MQYYEQNTTITFNYLNLTSKNGSLQKQYVVYKFICDKSKYSHGYEKILKSY